MGYYSTIRGSITFDPPCSYSEVLALDFERNLFVLAVSHEEVQTNEGILNKTTSNEIVPLSDEGTKAYGLEADLQAFVDKLPGRKFSGEFRIEGEAAGDVQRLFIDDQGQVTLWKAKLLWPDGEESAR